MQASLYQSNECMHQYIKARMLASINKSNGGTCAQAIRSCAPSHCDRGIKTLVQYIKNGGFLTPSNAGIQYPSIYKTTQGYQ